jgi:lipopolysaccharide export LptBFGC system permease protein LptF
VVSIVPVKGMTTSGLLHASDRVLRSELHWRVAKIVSIPILMLFALSTGAAGGDRDRPQRLVPAFLFYFGYANLMGFVLALMRKGTVPTGAMTVMHVAFLALAGHAFMRRAGNRPLIPFARGGRSRPVRTASAASR